MLFSFAVVSFSFQFSEDDYRATEMPNAMMPVRITRSPPDVVLDNPVTFSITPLTVQQALDLDILPASIPADQPSAYAGMYTIVANIVALCNLHPTLVISA